MATYLKTIVPHLYFPGLILIILGALYLIKTFRGVKTVIVHKTVTHHRRNSSLVFHEMSTQTEEDLLQMVNEAIPKTSGSANEKGEGADDDSAPSTSGANGNAEESEDGGASIKPAPKQQTSNEEEAPTSPVSKKQMDKAVDTSSTKPKKKQTVKKK
ncbi:hypothetical protein ElyMa_001627200 [Elysia marginata]|uniref:Resistance to inhibitors of cholinesterase protein 3 N-terminal domain-containing protein n=1 Tax=Elysia marginata TaxID=1093978 RepID=A0AAV4JPN2_9GAST|nr:hypothetical protein ElyMa_001627200 [Elysia marginata]